MPAVPEPVRRRPATPPHPARSPGTALAMIRRQLLDVAGETVSAARQWTPEPKALRRVPEIAVTVDWQPAAGAPAWTGRVAAAATPGDLAFQLASVAAQPGQVLLVSGPPGIGKTTFLRALTETLLGRAEVGDRAVPALLDLSGWPGGRVGADGAPTTLDDWVVATLAARTTANRRVIDALRRDQGLILLLDGYDLVDERIRGGLVRSLAARRRPTSADGAEQAHPGLVVCCRDEELPALRAAFDDPSVLGLAPADAAALDAWLAERGAAGRELRRVARADAGARELLMVPEALIAALPDEPGGDLSAGPSTPADLAERHVTALLDGCHRSVTTPREALLTSLGWLARSHPPGGWAPDVVVARRLPVSAARLLHPLARAVAAALAAAAVWGAFSAVLLGPRRAWPVLVGLFVVALGFFRWQESRPLSVPLYSVPLWSMPVWSVSWSWRRVGRRRVALCVLAAAVVAGWFVLARDALGRRVDTVPAFAAHPWLRDAISVSRYLAALALAVTVVLALLLRVERGRRKPEVIFAAWPRRLPDALVPVAVGGIVGAAVFGAAGCVLAGAVLLAAGPFDAELAAYPDRVLIDSDRSDPLLVRGFLEALRWLVEACADGPYGSLFRTSAWVPVVFVLCAVRGFAAGAVVAARQTALIAVPERVLRRRGVMPADYRTVLRDAAALGLIRREDGRTAFRSPLVQTWLAQTRPAQTKAGPD